MAYAYDRNGNKTGSSEKGTFVWPQPSLTDERADYTAAGRLKTRTIHSVGDEVTSLTNNQSLTSAATIQYAYDPSGNMTNATGNGQSWSLAYDEHNRTTSIQWDCGVTSKRITNRYDALGRRVAKTVDGLTTGYILSLLGGMERILCDLDAAGNVTAWYFHGPDLCYRVDAANNLVCYHADAMANIISLTGTNGTNLAQYAYPPYGRSLGSSAISNPFTFVGSKGVMEELPGLYFMRARYYSADAGVFLSTDPVKKIGPGWKPELYQYAGNNPLSFSDPDGKQLAKTIDTLVDTLIEKIIIISFFKAAVWDVGRTITSAILQAGGYSRAESIQGSEIFFGSPNRDISLNAWLDDPGEAFWNWLATRPANNTPIQPLANNPITQITFGMTWQGIQQNPLFQQTKNIATGATPLFNGQVSTAGDSTGKPTTDGAVNAANHAQSLNGGQQTNPTGNSTGNGTTTQNTSTGGSSSAGGNNAFTKIITNITQSQIYQSVTSTVKNVVTTVSQAISSAVKSVGSFISGFFGGGR